MLVLPSAHAVVAVGVGVTLDFSGNICGVSGNTACAHYSQIGQSYGDVTGVLDVSHRSAVAATGATFESYLKYWSTGYSGLTGVAWGGSGPTTHFSEMTFTAGIGQQVPLDSLDFGDYLNRNYGSKVAVYDLSNPSGSPLWDGGTFNPGLTPRSLHRGFPVLPG